MKKPLLVLTAALLLSAYWAAPGHAQSSYAGAPGAVIGLVRMIADQKKANDEIVARTTTTTTYRGQSFLVKRSPDDILAGDAADRITQLETQLALCHTALFADSTGCICPAERLAAIQANIKYIGMNRSSWNQMAYRQELKFYLAEDKRRRLAAK